MEKYKSPLVTTDVVLFSFIEGNLKVLLIQRKNPPFQGDWAFPGGFLDYGEAPEGGALRELQEETGITNVVIEQLGAFGDPSRDPRGHTVSVAFFGFIDADCSDAKGADDAAEARWFDVTNLPKLAFDHNKIFSETIERLNDGIGRLVHLLPTGLTLRDLNKICDALKG